MGVGDQRFSCCSNRQGLASPRIAGVLMWLHNSSGHEQIRFDRGVMHLHWHPARGDAQIYQGRRVLRLIVDDPVTGHNSGAQLSDLFLSCGRPVHSGGAQKSNILVPHPGFFQLVQQGWDQQIIRAGTRAIGERNTDPFARPSQLPQWR